MNEPLFFESIKEHRGTYFTEYHPPTPSMPLATLFLVFTKLIEPPQAAALLEEETRRWLTRYPIPLMASALDEKEDLISVRGSNDNNRLCAWILPNTNEIALSWSPSDLDSFLKAHPIKPNLRVIYADVPFRTNTQIKEASDNYVREQRQHNFILKAIFVCWLAVIPAGIAIFEYFGPEWLGLAALTYALWKSWRAYCRITGRINPSRTEVENAEKERKMHHYYYHCERNPLGFERLRSENLAEDIRGKTREEARRLAEAANPANNPD